MRINQVFFDFRQVQRRNVRHYFNVLSATSGTQPFEDKLALEKSNLEICGVLVLILTNLKGTEKMYNQIKK